MDSQARDKLLEEVRQQNIVLLRLIRTTTQLVERSNALLRRLAGKGRQKQ